MRRARGLVKFVVVLFFDRHLELGKASMLKLANDGDGNEGVPDASPPSARPSWRESCGSGLRGRGGDHGAGAPS